MHGFSRDGAGIALLGGAPIEALLAEAKVATPAYFYDLDGIVARARRLVATLGDRGTVAYALKANSAGPIVAALGAAGVGADVVSAGELRVALGAGVPARRVVMSGVGKRDDELDAAMAAGVLAIQAESVEELRRVAARARALGRVASVSLRINPGVAADTHAHVATGHDEAKFGIPVALLGEAWEVIDAAADALVAVGVSTHVGSNLADTAAYLDAARVVCAAARARRDAGQPLEYVDFGGGFGVDYGGRPAPEPEVFAQAALALLDDEGLGDHHVLIEPGRSLVAPFGVLLSAVTQQKRAGQRRWVMLDAGMNDLVRPALYQARHRVELASAPPADPSWRVVGPVCESSDDFGEHALGEDPRGLAVLRDAGAYGFSMASEYNGRPLPAEVFVADGRVKSVKPSPGLARWVAERLDLGRAPSAPGPR